MMIMMLLKLLALTLAVKGSLGALPQFSWDTLPVFFHSSNTTGLYSDESLKTIAKYSMVTIEKWMGYDDKSMDDEDFMALTMKAVKNINPKAATYIYMSSYRDRPEMTRMAREFDQNPDYQLRTEDGKLVKCKKGYYVYDVSNLKVRNWWINICLNATKFSNGDGCFCDASQNVDGEEFTPPISAAKQKAWGDGLLTLTKDAQKALGDNNLLIGKSIKQPYVKAVQLQNILADNNTINSLITGTSDGLVMQAHVHVNVSCKGDLTDYMAAFLIGAGERNYFGCGNWETKGNDTMPLYWRPDYDKPLGKPTAPASYHHDTGMWTREFALGTKVTFDTNKNKGTIEWGKLKLSE